MAPRLSSDGAGGALVTWKDNRSGGDDIYLHHVGASGQLAFASDWVNGHVLSNSSGSQDAPAVILATDGAAITGWKDLASGARVFAERQAVSPVASVGRPIPLRMELTPAQPNPFSGRMRFTLSLEQRSPVALEIFDPQGRRIRTLARGMVEAGSSSYEWNGTTDSGSGLPPGLYFLRARLGTAERWERVVRLR